MDILRAAKARELAAVEASLDSWMVVRTCLGLGLTHTECPPEVQQLIEDMRERLGALLVERGMLTKASIDDESTKLS